MRKSEKTSPPGSKPLIPVGTVVHLFFLVALLVCLPMSGIIISGKDPTPYLEFPPRTKHVEHADFSWVGFLLMGAFVLAVVGPLLIQGIRFYSYKANQSREIKGKHAAPRYGFPFWATAGLLLGAVSWVIAWNRFDFVGEELQQHTFTPLWICYILVVNGITYRRKGSCLLTRRTVRYLLLFPVSALFWWFFEYLNRFVQNWYYTAGQDAGPAEYFWLATLPFSTVLPAVLATRELLQTFPLFDAGYDEFITFRVDRKNQRPTAAVILAIAGFGLALIGVFPSLLYPLLWISPLVVIVCVQVLRGEKTVFSELKDGNWSVLVCSGMAALVCGIFWEMWNFYSYSKWIYTVPYVQKFHIFEMPLMGFAGYLPFGLECSVVAALFGVAYRDDEEGEGEPANDANQSEKIQEPKKAQSN